MTTPIDDQRTRRRVELARVLQPTTEVWRPFIKSLSDHAIELALNYSIRCVLDLQRPRADFLTRTAWVPPVLTESAYATALHEFGHVASARAQALQQRHEIDRTSIVAPKAEAEAWSWAISNSYRRAWTFEMQVVMVRALGTYRRDAIGDELDAIEAVIQRGARVCCAAPDSVEGRLRRMDRQRREQRVRDIEHEERLRRAAQQRREYRVLEIQRGMQLAPALVAR